MQHASAILQQSLLQHRLPGEAIPGVHVEDASLVNGQVTDQAEAVHCLVAVDGHSVDEGGEAQAIAKCEGDDTGAGQQRLSCDMHNRHLQNSCVLLVAAGTRKALQ